MNTVLLAGLLFLFVVGVYAWNAYYYLPNKYSEYDCPRNELVKLPSGEVMCAGDVPKQNNTNPNIPNYNLTE